MPNIGLFYGKPPIEVLDRGGWRLALQSYEKRGIKSIRPKETPYGLPVMAVSVPPTILFFGQEFTIPVGFESDGASIRPRFARMFFESWGRDALGSFYHDYLLKLKQEGLLDWDKWIIDWVFYALLKHEGVPDFQAMVLYLAVRTRGL